jgi:hypothetical protein
MEFAYLKYINTPMLIYLMCNHTLPDELVIEQLTEAIEKKQFEIYNRTSINNLVLVIQNNSDECKELAIKLLGEYIKYCKNK